MNVLIVDDNDAVRQFVRLTLEEAGYQVVEASDGTEALVRLSEGKIDLLVADLYLPGQGGGDLVRTVTHQYPGHKIIVISGAFEHAQFEPPNSAGINAILPKPVTPETLVDMVQRVLGEKQVRTFSKTQGSNS